MDHSSFTSSSSDLRKFLIKAALLLAIVVGCDRLIGAVAEHWYFKTNDGDTGGGVNALLRKRSDVLVFGDSRAESHYVPDILGSGFHASAFNAGFKGANSLYQYALEQLVFDHYTPKLIIYDFSPYSIAKSKEDPYSRLYPLFPYWRNEHVWSLIAQSGLVRRLAFLSRIYPYNSKIHSIVLFNVFESRPNASNGYVAQYGTMRSEPIEPMPVPISYDDELVDYLDRFIVSAHSRGVKVIVTISPRFAAGSYEIPMQIRERLAELDIPVVDFGLGDFPEFANYRLFRDPDHLADEGAKLFSRVAVDKINELTRIPGTVTSQ
jgi:hypothetical protein